MKANQLREFIDEHSIETGLACITLAVLLFNHSEIRAHMSANGQIRDAVAMSQANLNQQLADAGTRESFQDLANLRYDGYCEPVFNLNKAGIYTALTPGMPVIKGDYAEEFKGRDDVMTALQPGHVLPEGTPVCDAYGNSSLLGIEATSNGLPVIGAIASTTDEARIDGFIQKHGGSKEFSVVH